MAKNQAQHQRDLIRDAVDSVDIKEFPEAWKKLVPLSKTTNVEMIESIDEDVITKSGKNFTLPINVYVSLKYEDGELSEVFPGSVEGHLDQGRPVIDRLDVDVSSFYYTYALKQPE
jgi:hypothetical protein